MLNAHENVSMIKAIINNDIATGTVKNPSADIIHTALHILIQNLTPWGRLHYNRTCTSLWDCLFTMLPVNL